jgi:hypothetical protein
MPQNCNDACPVLVSLMFNGIVSAESHARLLTSARSKTGRVTHFQQPVSIFRTMIDPPLALS